MPTTKLRYTSRTASQIREDLVGLIPELAPSWTSHGEDEPGMALVEMLVGVADGLHYYLDKQALETYLPTVRLRKNASSLAHLVGYRPRRTLAAQGTLRIITRMPLLHDVYIPARTQFTTQGGVPLVNVDPVFLPADFSGVRTVAAVQGEYHAVSIDSTGGTRVEIKIPHINPSEQVFEVTTYGQSWVEFRDSQPESPNNRWYHYFEDVDGSTFIQFRRELGNVPIAGTPVTVEYLLSQDINITSATPVNDLVLDVPEGLTESESEEFTESVARLEFQTGTLQGYRRRESAARLRYSAPLSTKTKNRAVTDSDYRFLARQIAGVKDLKLTPSDFYTRQIVAYVLMEDGEEPSQTLLDEVATYLDDRNDLTLDVVTEPAELQYFRCKVDVQPAVGHTAARAVHEVREELLKFFRTTVANFNRTLRISEVYNRANRPDSVEYVNLAWLYWDGESVGVSDLVPESEVHVPTIGNNLTVSPIISGS